MAPVLVVEDNEINAEIIMTLLGERGIPTELAVDGVESVEKCSGKSKDYYSLILMDIHMPRMNGYDAARILKNELGIASPILAMTASSENADSLESNGDAISGYIMKPYDPEIFKDLFVAANPRA